MCGLYIFGGELGESTVTFGGDLVLSGVKLIIEEGLCFDVLRRRCVALGIGLAAQASETLLRELSAGLPKSNDRRLGL
jgi:hypothetical protein